jgi:hypothetical protein
VKKHALVVAAVVVGLLAISAGVAAATDNLPEDQGIDTDPSGKYTESNSTYTTLSHRTTASPENVTVVVEVSESSREHLDELEEMGASVQSHYRKHAQVEVQAENLPVYRNLSWVETVRRPYEGSSAVVSEGVEVIDADDVHSSGTTGQNVKVGVLDNAGFDLSNPEISPNIADHRSFKPTGGIESGTDHGTSVSEIVVDVAPDSELYLANFRTGVEYANAVDWMRNQNVDVVVMSVGFFQQPYDGDGFASEVADDAVRNDGIVWVNAAGNSANSHWQGSFSNPDGNQFLNFGPGDEKNFLNGGADLSAGQPVRVTLSWDDWPQSDQDYDLLLRRASDDALVGISEGFQRGSQEPTEIIRTRVPTDGRYYVAVRIFDATAPQELEMFFVGGETPEHNVARSSVVAPAVGNEVTSVGAFFHGDGSLEEFSSRGPTNDGRTGVDVVAPDRVSTTGLGRFPGTSAAAPHVGGVAALVLSDDTSLSPSDVEQRLESTAVDIFLPGEDTGSGHGKVDALSAVRRGSATDFGVSVDSTNSPVVEGEALVVNATITNTGGSGTQTVTADVSGVGSESEFVSLNSGSSTEETFIIPTSVGDAGDHTVAVGSENDTASTMVTVESGGASVDGIRTTLTDESGDGLDDRVHADVTVSDVGTGQTIVELGETNFDVDVSPTDTGQAQFVTPQDTDGDGTNEAVEFVGVGTVSTTYTVVADLSNQADGDTGTVDVELGGGATSSNIFTIGELTGPLSTNNPFGDASNNPISRQTLINRIVEWNLNGEIDGTSYTRSEIINFVVEWNLAS